MHIFNPFSQVFDYRLESMKNDYILEAVYILETEANIKSDSEWYIKWKADMAMTLKSSFNKFKDYAQRQIQKYDQWLVENSKHFDTRRYVPTGEYAIEKAPNYKVAISRITKPFNSIYSTVLDKIDEDETKNVWFMHNLIGDYKGDGHGFGKYCEKYFYGDDQISNLNANMMVEYIPFMYKFCSEYKKYVDNLEIQLQSFISYLNRDPYNGAYSHRNHAEQELNTLKQNEKINGKASTNPQNNVVKESYLSRFIDIINETVDDVPQVKQIYNKNKNEVQLNKQQEEDKPINKPTDNKQDTMKKKRLACKIIQTYFNAKVNACGRIYRDFIATLQTVYYIHKENKK